jgi:branched-subunit amino acid transport protein
VSVELVGLALLMGLATYPSRAIPLLVPGMDRLPRPVMTYLRLVGPAVLAALAAVEVMVRLDADRNPSFEVGVEWLAVALCVVLVARFHNLLAGMASAVVLVAVARATGLA